MLIKRTPLLLAVGCWLVTLLLGLIGTTTIPVTVSADGIGVDTIPAGGGGDTTGHNNCYNAGDIQEPDEPSILTLTLILLL
jgi:hypothetical protein